MGPVRRVLVFVPLLQLALIGVGMAEVLSREEVDGLWEQLLREERYEAIQYLNRRYSTPTTHSPTRDKRIVVTEGREGYLGGFFGLSEGGGWDIRGQLEAEIPIEQAILQLYSKETIQWLPGFAFFWMADYDTKKYPIREFRLLLRHPIRRQEIRTLKSIPVAPGEVLPTQNPDGTSVKELIGQRIPRGEVQYDEARQVGVVQILGLHKPITVEVPISSPPFPDLQGK